ncbi:hypothetical protein ID858_17865 [Xenorhabdus sp. DI]|uniref:hypothetical protein n=1 Tax=Xenorhabdus doucetiae TaxID=351671 RepID=UPI0019AC6784|nr:MULTISPECIES: hypothetical protein [unclassified Xenorhabdus]MBD2786583.1 hypothetical protein [Xenorhabdus sp. 3]MBD2790354.1 hypothetical protein [Xenorhabdus sp. DI]
MKRYEDMVVIFLDILGSKEMSSFEEKYKVHCIFHESVKRSQELQHTEEKEHVIYTRKLFSFSDCAYVFYKYKPNIDESRKDINKLFQAALFNTSLMTLQLLNEGYLIRGGVTYGSAYFDDLSFFGPAVEDAYLLESKKANTPRVLIDPKFGEKIFLHEKKIYGEVFGPSSPNYNFHPKRSYIPTIVMEDNREFILNKLYILEMEGRMNFGNVLILHNEIKEKVEKNLLYKLEKYKANPRITQKLEWMMNYIKSSTLSLKSKPTGYVQEL